MLLVKVPYDRTAERVAALAKLNIPLTVPKASLTNAVLSDGGIEDGKNRLHDFFAVALPPEK